MSDASSAPAPGPKRSPLVQRVRKVVEQTRAAATAYDRADLARRIDERAAQLDDPSFHVLVVGEFKQGKSSLVNALVQATVCPVDDDIATAVPTLVRYADSPSAEVVLRPPDDPGPAPIDQGTGEPAGPPRRPIPLDEVPLYTTERQASGEQVQSVEVRLASERLRNGLVLVDTPGVGGLGSSHSTITMGALPMAEAVVFVSDASQEFSAAEISFMEQATSLCPNLVCVLTKTDFYPAWRKILDLDRGHLQRLGIDSEIVPVSSALHVRATAQGDAALDEESGFPVLDKVLRTRVLARAEDLTARAVTADLDAVITQLEGGFLAEKAALTDPERSGERQRDLEEAKRRADTMKSRSARWQQTLADGVQDLTADVDHDLRGRFRLVNQEADEALERLDPADAWGEFEAWLSRRVAVDVVNNYRYLQARSRDLAALVGDHFALEARDLTVDLNVGDPTEVLGSTSTAGDLDLKKMGLGQTMMTGVRGGYIGMLMFGVLGSMVGLALGPLPIGIGLVMGRKHVREEKDRQLNQRRGQARNAQRKYIDEVQFSTGKEMRDAVRRIQRNLRDYFTARAEEQSRSVNEQLAAVQRAAKTDGDTARKRLTDVNAELKRLADLRSRLELATPQAPS